MANVAANLGTHKTVVWAVQDPNERLRFGRVQNSRPSNATKNKYRHPTASAVTEFFPTSDQTNRARTAIEMNTMSSRRINQVAGLLKTTRALWIQVWVNTSPSKSEELSEWVNYAP